MRRVRIEHAVAPGTVLARDVLGASGEVVARAGHELNLHSVHALAERLVVWCFVDDPLSAGLDVSPLDSEAGAVRSVLGSFHPRIIEVVESMLRLPTPRALHFLGEALPTAPHHRTCPCVPAAARCRGRAGASSAHR